MPTHIQIMFLNMVLRFPKRKNPLCNGPHPLQSVTNSETQELQQPIKSQPQPQFKTMIQIYEYVHTGTSVCMHTDMHV